MLGHCLIKGQISSVFERKDNIEMHIVFTLEIYQYDMSIKIMYQTVHNSSFVLNCALFSEKRSKNMSVP